MKTRYVSSKSISLLLSVGLMATLSACGGKFSPHANLSGAPVATADPLAAAKAKWAEGVQNGDAEISLFDNAKNEEGFNKSMNDEDFDLEKHAEYLETHPEETKSEAAPSYEDEAPEVETVDPREVVPADAPSVKAGGPSTKEEAAPAVPKAELPKAPKEMAQPEKKPETKSETKPETKSEAKPEEKQTATPEATPVSTPKPRPKFKAIAVPKFAKDICETTNIKSSVKPNLDHLYDDKTPLPSNLPAEELKQMRAKEKQNQFICLLIPHALRMNAVVFNQRVYVARMQYRHSKGIMKDADKEWVSKMKEAYKLSQDASIEDLLKRVDVVPLPMLLTQAAVESGWGTSKAVREVRNLFGMHGKVGDANCRLGYEKDGKSCLVVFPTITASVAYYIRLLNRGTAYEKFRTLRAQMRKAGKPLDSSVLLTGIERYSERGQAYIENLKSIMTVHNKLDKYEMNETKMAEKANAGGAAAAALAPAKQ